MNENFRIEDFVKERQKDPEAAGRNAMKRIAAINDMSGFGKCSLTVALPIISAMGIQCCPLPTSILSNQTGYPDFYCVDFTEHMRKYIDQWRRLDLHFDGIVSGCGTMIEYRGEVLRYFRVFFILPYMKNAPNPPKTGQPARTDASVSYIRV